MQISKFDNKDKGFTLTELIVVVAGLATLASISIPRFQDMLKLNRVEEAKALMNSYASDCLRQTRIYEGNDLTSYLSENPPRGLDSEKLSTLGYKIDGNKKNCNNIGIKPKNEKEKNLFSIEFLITDTEKDGVRLAKIATPSSNPSFLNSCKSWAGEDCTLSEERKAEFAKLSALAKAKSECIAKYNKWLDAGESGEFVTWNSNRKNCTTPVYAFEGRPVSSPEAIKEEQNAKYGRACAEWRDSKMNSISPNGNPETKNPECGGVKYWFHSGNIFTTQAAWTFYDNQLKAQACTENKMAAQSQNITGKYTYKPSPGPDPCGKVVWLCKGEEYGTESAYKTSSCYTPPVVEDPGGPYIPPHCRNFKPHPYCKGRPQVQNHPLCKCR